MALAHKTLGIFVSSTFSDMKEERNALQRVVFPELRKLCMQHGYCFQAIDLRWGVREESALGHQMRKLSLNFRLEVFRTLLTTNRPEIYQSIKQ